MNGFERELSERLAAIREQGLHRELRRVESPQDTRIVVDGRELLNFSSNDYLGLANHPMLREAATTAIKTFGAGSGASRLICGSLAIHHELDESLAAFKGTEAALTFSSGYATALGTIGALVDKNDVLIIDKLVHACVVDAARQSGAELRVFDHNDPDHLESILKWADNRSGTDRGTGRRPRILIVTESVFSMDGDQAPLREIVALKDRYGAWLMVDEAHATGLFGEKRHGLVEAAGLGSEIEIQMGTLGKALGSAGGYVCGSRTLIDYLVNRARSFIFSTAPVPAASAAAKAAIDLVQSDEGRRRCDTLWMRIDSLRAKINQIGLSLPPDRTAIIPLRIGDEIKAMETAAGLREHGVFIPAVRFPTVARGEARLRLTVTAAHKQDDVDRLVHELASAKTLDRNS